MTTFTTTVAGFPARIDHLDHGTPRYLVTVALDGHLHAVIEEPADGTPVRWRLLYFTPTGWHLDPNGHGTASTPHLAAHAADAYANHDGATAEREQPA